MMKNFKYIFSILFVLIAFAGCEVDDIADITQEEPVVVFENGTYNASIILTETTDNFPVIRLRLFGEKQERDISVAVSIDQANTTAIIGEEFSLNSTSVTIPAGESYANVDYEIDRNKLEADVNKQVVLSLGNTSGARGSQMISTINLKKTIIDLNPWAGAYTFEGDGWTRDSEVRLVAGENYKLTLYSFWGNGLEMTGDVDVTDPHNPKLVVPAGTLLDYGWDSRGKWYLENDLIANFDMANMTLVFTQFDYVCDDGSAGSFPWCSGVCNMKKN